MRPSGKQAEGQRELRNEVMRLDFDPRTSDTMYNYIWVKRTDSGTAGPFDLTQGLRQGWPWHTAPSPQPSPRGRGDGNEGSGGGGEGHSSDGLEPGRWERVHNFGIDVGAYRSDTGELINTIGMNLILSRRGAVASGGHRSPEPRGRPHRAGGRPPLPVPADGAAGAEARVVRLRYPHPLIQYRQFDDKIGTREKVAKYPDFTPAEMPGLVHADASLEFLYEVDEERPSFVVSGRVLTGKVHHVVYIIDALWTDNHALPTHEYVDGVGEFDIRTPEAVNCREVEVAGKAFALFYRDDGDGVPFALLPQSPEPARFCNYYDNWKCHHDFRSASLNQQFIPQEPPVTGCNDTGYIVSPRADGSLPGVRVAFFPESGWGRGGDGHQLRDRLLAAIRERC